jgi:hypothetical protein
VGSVTVESALVPGLVAPPLEEPPSAVPSVPGGSGSNVETVVSIDDAGPHAMGTTKTITRQRDIAGASHE